MSREMKGNNFSAFFLNKIHGNSSFLRGVFKEFFIPFLSPTNKQFNEELRMEPKP